MRHLAIILCMLASGQVAALAAPAELKLEAGSRSQTVTLSQLKKKLKTATLTVDDPVYGKKKTYEGFWLKDVLEAGGLSEQGGDEIVFRCSDGYSPSLSLSLMASAQGLLAFRDKGVKGGWERFQKGKMRISPAPFYLVWDSKDKSLPWPYQVVGIEVVKFKQKYARLFPDGVDKEGAVYRGFEAFRNQCLRCHSVNLQGGTLGPELNVPKNITEYMSEEVILKFIRNPADFRARSKMPAFADLSEADLRAILEYLRWMKGHKKEE